MVLDADALNILAEQKTLLDLLPEGTILTPHPGEFRRLVGDWEDDFEKMEMLRSFCKKYKLHVVFKGAYSMVCNSDGDVFLILQVIQEWRLQVVAMYSLASSHHSSPKVFRLSTL